MSKIEIEDELRPEYDLQSLQVRKLGPGRKKFCDTVRLEPDVMAAFPNAEAVNEALRYLIEVAKRTNSLTQRSAAELGVKRQRGNRNYNDIRCYSSCMRKA